MRQFSPELLAERCLFRAWASLDQTSSAKPSPRSRPWMRTYSAWWQIGPSDAKSPRMDTTIRVIRAATAHGPVRRYADLPFCRGPPTEIDGAAKHSHFVERYWIAVDPCSGVIRWLRHAVSVNLCVQRV